MDYLEEKSIERGNVTFLGSYSYSSVKTQKLFGVCAQYGRVDGMIVLLNNKHNKPSIHAISGYNQKTPLMYAADGGSEKAVRFLIELGAKVNEDPLGQGRTALLYASNIDIVTTLLHYGANPNVQSNIPIYEHNTFYQKVSYYKRQVPIMRQIMDDNVVKLLLEHHAISDLTDENGYHIITYAALAGSNEILELLITKINDRNERKRLLNHAVLSIVKKLGLDIKWKSSNSLLIAEQIRKKRLESDIEKITTLIRKGADRDTRDDELKTPLIWAVINRFDHVAKTLIDLNCDVNLEDSSGKTAVDYALENQEIPMFDLLNRNGSIVTGSMLLKRNSIDSILEAKRLFGNPITTIIRPKY
ncbi:ankyrin repeat domain-containing protein [Paenibacillus agricola]|uniref:Ankyrin repeat protein n=1 Tax=Paenibacillus agricola TaxID=2716264 RepID=A0ABX0JIM4_9BACL|nr:ankyrin repeat domain-containing protein [Paenibacillus agricola]NHN34842.1 hypothetical protein [Paenibacillus agricola]